MSELNEIKLYISAPIDNFDEPGSGFIGLYDLSEKIIDKIKENPKTRLKFHETWEQVIELLFFAWNKKGVPGPLRENMIYLKISLTAGNETRIFLYYKEDNNGSTYCVTRSSEFFIPPHEYDEKWSLVV